MAPLRSHVTDALDGAEEVIERLALAEVDSAMFERAQSLTLPAFVIIALMGLGHAAGVAMGTAEGMRLVVSTIVLAAAIYAIHATVAGARAVLPYGLAWCATTRDVTGYVRLQIYAFLLGRLDASLRTATGETTIGSVVLRLLSLSGGPRTVEALAWRLAVRITPVVLRHAGQRLLLVLGPILGAWAYYRFVVYPEMVQTDTGLSPWSAPLYPLAALCDAVFGTTLRSVLLT
ncbi:MAG: hypothetical protein SF002_11180 [Alphaproteobacteria bacterium]|nr:hypothetical protein [Alphaproteobacteria bacterium]